MSITSSQSRNEHQQQQQQQSSSSSSSTAVEDCSRTVAQASPRQFRSQKEPIDTYAMQFRILDYIEQYYAKSGRNVVHKMSITTRAQHLMNALVNHLFISMVQLLQQQQSNVLNIVIPHDDLLGDACGTDDVTESSETSAKKVKYSHDDPSLPLLRDQVVETVKVVLGQETGPIITQASLAIDRVGTEEWRNLFPNHQAYQYLKKVFPTPAEQQQQVRVLQRLAINLGTICEYLCSEILELASNTTLDNRKCVICSHFIRTEIKYDQELCKQLTPDLLDSLDLIIKKDDLAQTPDSYEVIALSSNNNNSEQASFAMLPHDVHLLIIKSQSKAKDLLVLRLICKKWNQMIMDEANEVWKQLLFNALIESPYYPLCTTKTLKMETLNNMIAATEKSWSWFNTFVEKISMLQQKEREMMEAMPEKIEDIKRNRKVVITLFNQRAFSAPRTPPPITVGETRTGNMPDLLPEEVYESKWGSFFCQINLKDCRTMCCHTGLLPSEGLLSVFINKEEDNHYSTRIRYYNASEMERLRTVSFEVSGCLSSFIVGIKEHLTCSMIEHVPIYQDDLAFVTREYSGTLLQMFLPDTFQNETVEDSGASATVVLMKILIAYRIALVIRIPIDRLAAKDFSHITTSTLQNVDLQ